MHKYILAIIHMKRSHTSKSNKTHKYQAPVPRANVHNHDKYFYIILAKKGNIYMVSIFLIFIKVFRIYIYMFKRLKREASDGAR